MSAGKEAGFELLNSLGEKVKIYLDASEAKLLQLVQMGTGQSILHGNLTRRVTF